MNRQPRVSIITPVFNGSAFLESLIISIRDQDYPFIEHIVIDDGSDDEGMTQAILKKFPHVRWWSRENRGQYASMNEGLLAAEGEIVSFISADDLLADHAVAKAAQWLAGHAGFQAVYGLSAYQSGNDQPGKVNRWVRYAPLNYYPFLPHEAQFQHCSFFVTKNTLLEKELLFDPKLKFGGDYDWIIRLLKSGVKIGYMDEVLSTIRVHPHQASAVNREAMAREKLEIAQRYGIKGMRFQFLIKKFRDRLSGSD